MAQAPASIETPRSWWIAAAVVAIFVVSYGASLPSAVALTQIAASFEGQRSIPALANALVWLGSGLGGIFLSPLAERIGIRAMVSLGGVMIALGFYVSTLGGATALILGHGLLVGVIGTGAIHAPLYVYVSRWFDRHRGSAIALVASGQYLGGAFWPTLILWMTTAGGWQGAMRWFGLIALVGILPLALLFLKAAPAEPPASAADTAMLATRPRGAFAWLCLASVLCCVPMAMPGAHLPAMCGDAGIPPSTGAAMLSLLLGLGFVSRQFWGWLSDRVGGLTTVAAASACQAAAILGYLMTRSEAGLFAVSALFGLGFSGIIPAYFLTVRQMFGGPEAVWRVPILFFCSLIGMAIGGFGAGLIYDQTASYAPAFSIALAANLANVAILVGLLMARPAAPRAVAA